VELVSAQDDDGDLLRLLADCGSVVAVDAGLAAGCGCGSGVVGSGAVGVVVIFDAGRDAVAIGCSGTGWRGRTSDELAHLPTLAMPVPYKIEVIHHPNLRTLLKRLRALRSADSVLIIATQELSEPFNSLGNSFLIVAFDCDDGAAAC